MSAYKRGNKWSFRVYINDPKTLKRKQYEKRGFETKKDAKRAEIEFLSQINQNQNPLKTNIKFADAYKYYLEEKKKEWKDTSFYGNKTILDSRVNKYFQNYEIAKINKDVINGWRKWLDSKNYKQNYKNKLLTNLKGIFRYANIEFNINNHIMDNEPPFRNDASLLNEKYIYTENQFIQFSDVIGDIKYKMFFNCLFYTGIRVGEIRALKWQDLDLTEGSISVNKAITNKVYGKTYDIITPKTGSSIRKIYYPRSVLNPLFDLYKKEIYKSEVIELNHFVFGCEKPLAETTIRRMNSKYAKIANLPVIRIHDYRHSYITMLYNKNIDMITAKDQVGHSSIKTTADIYLKLDAEKRKQNINQAFA